MKFIVQHNDGDGEWLTGVREDLYDGTNDEVLDQCAEFDRREDAEQYITDICGLMHCGGDPADFRIQELS